MTQESYRHPIAPPPGYIDAEHTGHDRELLETFYLACRSEGGTVDEIHLRGLKAVLALSRPKPPSLKEQALKELQMAYDTSDISMVHLDTIRRALEQLPDAQ